MKSDPYVSSECLQRMHNDCDVPACQCRCHKTNGLQPMFGDEDEAGTEESEGESGENDELANNEDLL